MSRRGQIILENLIYYLIWLIVFAVTVIGFTEDGQVFWKMVGCFWLLAIPLFLLFLLNNYFLIPRFLLRRRYKTYVISVLLSILAVAAFTLMTHRPLGPEDFPRHPRFRNNVNIAPRELSEEQAVREFEPGGDGWSPGFTGPREERKPGKFRKGMPPRPLPVKWGPTFGVLLFAFFIVGLNIAIKLMFKTVNDGRRLEDLERQNLRAELDYLKAQVNPHFFMNTLNNIHALVDIDTDKAKETIIELSKIMRYILYETDKTFVSLKLEVKFIRNYVSLMSIRYADSLSIKTSYPDSIPEGKIAPLLLITLVENAFKHGISYRQESFITTSLEIRGDRLVYAVENSRTDNAGPEGGVGLENMRKRLSLLYGEDYLLQLEQKDGLYVAVLEIPIIS